MRFIAFIAVLATFLWSRCQAEVNLTEVAAELPQCGLKCTIAGVTASGCGLNSTCMCSTPSLAANVQVCLEKECSVREALTSAKVFGAACQKPIRDCSMGLIFAPMPLGTLAIVSVVLRIYARTRNGLSEFGPDDWTIVAAMTLGLPFTGLGLALKHYGFGKDIWEIPFDDITKLLRTFYIDEQFYFAVLTLTKVSILLFYLRVFPDQGFRRVVWVAIAVNIAWGIVANAITLFQCWPIAYYWDRWDGTHKGHCNSASVQAWVTALFNMALDISIMLLPLPQLLKLQLSWKKKIHILIMFLVGIFVTIVSAVRLQALEKFSKSSNPTYDNVPAAYWSSIEGNTGIICACLPACRSLLSKFFKSALDYTNASWRSRMTTRNDLTNNNTKSGGGMSALKTPRLNTMQFREPGTQGTFVELNNYPSNSDGIHRADSHGKSSRDHVSDDGSDHMILQGSAEQEKEWQDEKKQPTSIVHAV